MMAANIINEWYDRQRERDRESEALSQSLLGPEGQIFADSMSATARCLNAVFAVDQTDDLVVKRKISVAHYAFNLLWSAWTEALAGRYHTATDHFRSIDEAPDFLTALDIDPSLADQMGGMKSVKIERARRAIRKALEQADPRKASQWQAVRTTQGKRLRPLSHISLEALGQRLPVIVRDGQIQAVVRLGGAVSQFTLRPIAIHLALSALSLLLTARHAFYGVVDMEDHEWKALAEKSGRLATDLSKELKAMEGQSPGTIDVLYLAATDEVIG